MLIDPYRFGGLWTPSQITTALWLDASDAATVTESSGLVSQINDKSGNGRNFTATGTARPTLTANALGALSALTYSGSESLTSSSAASTWAFLHNSTGSSIFVLWKPGTTSNPDTFLSCIGNNSGSSSNIGLTLLFDDRSTVPRNNALVTFITDGTPNAVVNATTADNFATPNQYQVFGWVLNPSAAASSRSSVRVNGGAASQTNAATGTPASADPTYTLQVGALGNNVGPLIGAIAEVVIVSGVISDANRQKIEGYMAWRGGLSSSLPSDHPYKSAAPTV